MAETKMMTCKKCGTEIENKSQKCPNCGEPTFTTAVKVGFLLAAVILIIGIIAFFYEGPDTCESGQVCR